MRQTGLKIFTFALVIIGMAGAFVVGVYYGYTNRPEVDKITSVIHKEPEIANSVEPVDFEPFWKAWNAINEKYVATGSSTDLKVTSQDRVWGAVSGMVNSLGDPYTTFFPPEENKSFNADISGNFGGVGMEVGKKDNILTVISALPDTPAKRAGVRSGDQILKINDQITADMNTDEAVRLIRGEVGTKVRITIFREGEKDPRDITLTRATINIPAIDSKLITTVGGKKLTRGVFVISLYNFSAVSPDLFRQKLREFIMSGSDKLVLDLRGNPGGYLEAAVDMASWFLPKGAVVVRESYGHGEPEKVYRSLGYEVFNKNLKMVILVDRGSASAAEILAGALSEQGIADLVGDTTYGKGSVQELVPITSDTSLKVTVARWLTPNGHSISQSGLEPKYKVKLTEDDIKNGRDLQLDKALQVITSK